MSWPHSYTAYSWQPFLTVLLLITLSLYSWRRRSVPGALPFMIGCLFAALWVTGAILNMQRRIWPDLLGQVSNRSAARYPYDLFYSECTYHAG
jgi:hypothetical protein